MWEIVFLVGEGNGLIMEYNKENKSGKILGINSTVLSLSELAKMIKDTIDLFKPGLEKFNIRFEITNFESDVEFEITEKIDLILLSIVQKFLSKKYCNNLIKIKFKLDWNKSTLQIEKLKVRFSTNLSKKAKTKTAHFLDLTDFKNTKLKFVNKKNGNECIDLELSIFPITFRNLYLNKNIASYYSFPAQSCGLVQDKFIEDFKEHIASYKTIENISFDELCSHFAMSRSTLYRRIKISTGMSPSKFIRSHYLKMAANRLIDTNDPITEIAYDFGFNNSSYFSKSFKEHFSESPMRFRNKNKNRKFL